MNNRWHILSESEQELLDSLLGMPIVATDQHVNDYLNKYDAVHGSPFMVNGNRAWIHELNDTRYALQIMFSNGFEELHAMNEEDIP